MQWLMITVFSTFDWGGKLNCVSFIHASLLRNLNFIANCKFMVFFTVSNVHKTKERRLASGARET